MDSLHLRLTYDGAGPAIWTPAPGAADAFGAQDKAGMLHPGTPGASGVVVFDLLFALQSRDTDAPVLSGDFAHGPPAARFVYLGWRNAQGNFAQRLKLPLHTIAWSDVREALAKHEPLIGTLVDHHPRATTTGANIGGTRAIAWSLA